jgi:hypothetical protein
MRGKIEGFLTAGISMHGKIENPLTASISRGHAAQGIILPPTELSRVEGKLHTIFARLQVLLSLLSCVEILDHGYVAQWPAGRVADDVHRRSCPNCFSVLADVALFHVEDV